MAFSPGEMDTIDNYLQDMEITFMPSSSGICMIMKNILAPDFMKWVLQTDVVAPITRIVQISQSAGSVDYSTFLPNGMLSIESSGPVDMVVTDPDGLTINKEKNEIPGAVYLEGNINGIPNDVIYFEKRKMGEYKTWIIAEKEAKSTDNYTLDISAMEKCFGYVPILKIGNTSLSEIKGQGYTFTSKQRETTHLTYSGDFKSKSLASVSLKAILTDSSGKPLSGKKISFTLGGQEVTAITDNNGMAEISLIVNRSPSMLLSFGCFYRR